MRKTDPLLHLKVRPNGEYELSIGAIAVGAVFLLILFALAITNHLSAPELASILRKRFLLF